MTGLGTVRRVPSPNRVRAKPHGDHTGTRFRGLGGRENMAGCRDSLDASRCAFPCREASGHRLAGRS